MVQRDWTDTHAESHSVTTCAIHTCAHALAHAGCLSCKSAGSLPIELSIRISVWVVNVCAITAPFRAPSMLVCKAYRRSYSHPNYFFSPPVHQTGSQQAHASSCICRVKRMLVASHPDTVQAGVAAAHAGAGRAPAHLVWTPPPPALTLRASPPPLTPARASRARTQPRRRWGRWWGARARATPG